MDKRLGVIAFVLIAPLVALVALRVSDPLFGVRPCPLYPPDLTADITRCLATTVEDRGDGTGRPGCPTGFVAQRRYEGDTLCLR